MASLIDVICELGCQSGSGDSRLQAAGYLFQVDCQKLEDYRDATQQHVGRKEGGHWQAMALATTLAAAPRIPTQKWL
jgi:hypothetical protein